MKLIKFLVVLIASSAMGAFIPEAETGVDDGKIVGGEVIDLTDAPYQISLQYYGRHICGGSIISGECLYAT